MQQETNRLIHSTSPYLLQHAYNPVDWFPWGKEALEKAQLEDKPVIVSIGYAACHWCHVMEHESFESQEVADIMNTHFVCIKVDREERPDVDAIYMDAIAAMGQRGGWPLNAFLTPDMKPFYAGTYFPKENWMKLMMSVVQAFKSQREEVEKSAESFRVSISRKESEKYHLDLETGQSSFSIQAEELKSGYEKLKENFDTMRGGMNRAPKFPMPSIYQYLLHYYQLTKEETALNHSLYTLKEMAKGGIYDQIGGGFARYSVDSEWFAPHFEKMLYDNGQLIGLFSDAYNISKDDFFKNIVYESIDFVERELTSPEGGFYSALDADSEGEEGKFYVWQAEELKEILKEDELLFTAYYNIKEEGNWEHNNNILHLKISDSEFAAKHQISLDDLKTKVQTWKKTLMEVRSKRIRPALDDKILTSWNALMLKGLVDAYRVFGEQKFLDLALKNAQFIQENLQTATHLWRTYKDGKAHLLAYLEDYACVVEAYIALYQVTFNKNYLDISKKLTDYVLNNFQDESEALFFYTDVQGETLIARKKEVFDNVIPASNSIMAKNLFFLGKLLDKSAYSERAKEMLQQAKRIILLEIEYLANWGQLATYFAKPTPEIVIIGEDYQQFRTEIDQQFEPNKILIASEKPSQELPLLEYRDLKDDKTTIYVCFNKACQLPVNTVQEALKLIPNE